MLNYHTSLVQEPTLLPKYHDILVWGAKKSKEEILV